MGGASVRWALTGGVMLLLLAAPAGAAHVSGTSGVRSYATATFPGASGFIVVTNDTVSTQSAGGGASVAGGGLTPGGFTNFANVIASADGRSAQVNALSSLEQGRMGVSSVTVDGFPQVTSGGSSELFEMIWFTNTTAQSLPLLYSITLDGSITGVPDKGWYLGGNMSSGGSGAANANGTFVRLGDGNGPLSASPDTAFRVGYNHITGFFQQDTLGNAASWTVTGLAGNNFNGGPWNLSISTTLWVPPGETSLQLLPILNLTSCGSGTGVCDLGNTARVSFGALPSGLSWTSQSGLFLSGLDNGAVPEPASWGLLIAGFGLTGAVARRRRAVAS
jgi:hypothetical protein